MLLQLPDWSSFKKKKVKKPFKFLCEGTWINIPDMDFKLEIESKQTHLLIYNVVVPLKKKTMSIAIYLDDQQQVSILNKYNRKDQC